MLRAPWASMFSGHGRRAASVRRDVRTRPGETVGDVTAALGWGALAASSLVIGAVIGLLRTWPPRLVGLVLAFGAGALISAVSFDLAEEAGRLGDTGVAGARPRPRRAHVLHAEPPGGSGGAAAATTRDPRSRSAPSSTASPSRRCSGSASRRARASASACWSRSSSPTSRGDRLVDRDARARHAAATIRRLWLLVAAICAWPPSSATRSPTTSRATSTPASTGSPPARCW